MATQRSLKEIKREYKERKKPAGIFQVRNTVNGRVLLGSSMNLEGPLNRIKFELRMGLHKYAGLQKEWNELGPEAFAFEIVEVVKESDDLNFSLEDELTLLEQIWLDKVQPYGEKGYNTDQKIRWP